MPAWSLWVPQERIHQTSRFRSLWSDFVKSTGLHGINHLQADNALKYKVRIGWWTCVILAMVGALTFILVTAVLEFKTYPTMTKYSVQVKKALQFPTITICNFSPISAPLLTRENVKDIDKFLLSLSPMYSPSITVNWTADPFYQTEMTAEWYEQVAAKDWFFNRCFFGGVDLYPCNDDNVFTKVHTNTGLCYQFNSNSTHPITTSVTGSTMNLAVVVVPDQQHYTFTQDPAAGVRIKIHDQHIHPDDVSSEIIAGVGTSSYIQLSKIEYTFLPKPYTAFGDRTCIALHDPDTDVAYTSYSECIRTCLSQKVFKKCGCYRVSHTAEGRRCTPELLVTCYLAYERELVRDPDVIEQCACFSPCEFNQYKTEVSKAVVPSAVWAEFLYPSNLSKAETIQLLRQNTLELRIFYEDLIVEKFEQLPQYSVTDLLAGIGGHMGLFLGASILTLTELGEFVVLAIASCFKKKSLKKDEVVTLKEF